MIILIPVPVDMDVRMKATMMGALFLVVSLAKFLMGSEGGGDGVSLFSFFLIL